jgi:RNA polymerase sigma-70 factor (ECF subfamily)
MPQQHSQQAPPAVTPSAGAGYFPSTHWSVVLAANGDQTSAVTAALETLFRSYQKPLYAYLRRRNYAHHDAEDLFQAFFSRLLTKDVLRAASQQRGRFRSFLLASLKNFLANEHDRSMALKRGGGESHVSLDVATPSSSGITEPAALEPSPERFFDREWAQTTFAAALQRLEQEFASEGKQTQFTALAPFLSRLPETGEYEKVAALTGIRPGLMATVVSRLRHRFRDLARSEIASTVDSPAEVDEEMRYLVELMTG